MGVRERDAIDMLIRGACLSCDRACCVDVSIAFFGCGCQGGQSVC